MCGDFVIVHTFIVDRYLGRYGVPIWECSVE